MNGKLYRSRNNRLLGGVCGGLAAWLGITPLAARVIYLLLALLPGPAWIAYVLLWIIIPLEPQGGVSTSEPNGQGWA